MTHHVLNNIPIVILGAGASRRMRGTDKLLQMVDGLPLIRKQAAMARAVTHGEVIVALPAAQNPLYAALDGLDVTPLAIADAVEGINASIRTAIAALPVGTDVVMLILADLPDLTAADLKAVIAKVDLTSDTVVWRGATSDGAAGHPIVFAASLFPTLAALTGDTGGRAVIAQAKDKTEIIRLPGDRARLDLDTPEDWAKWRKRTSDFPQE